MNKRAMMIGLIVSLGTLLVMAFHSMSVARPVFKRIDAAKSALKPDARRMRVAEWTLASLPILDAYAASLAEMEARKFKWLYRSPVKDKDLMPCLKSLSEMMDHFANRRYEQGLDACSQGFGRVVRTEPIFAPRPDLGQRDVIAAEAALETYRNDLICYSFAKCMFLCVVLFALSVGSARLLFQLRSSRPGRQGGTMLRQGDSGSPNNQVGRART